MKLRHKIPLVIFFICIVCGLLAYVLIIVTKGREAWLIWSMCAVLATIAIITYLRDPKTSKVSQNNNEG